MVRLFLARAMLVTKMLLLSKLIYFVTAADLISAWDWRNDSQPIAIFRSRPDLLAPILTPLEGIHQPDRMAPGYFFVAPYANMQPGIYIYDNHADLIYSSFGSYGPGPSHSPRVCNYHGKPHLCFYQGVQHVGWGHGHGVIMDQNYRVVRSVEPSCTYQASSDMHEFYLNEDGTKALMTQYVRSVYDLCPWGLCDGLGYIQSGWFQEVDVETGSCLFSWSSLEHIPPEDSYVLPDSTEVSGNGESPETPWDYFHINSVDKSRFDGGYLISARHLCAIYKVDASTGRILWILGGKKNEYEYDNIFGDILFGFQHDARWISDSEDESVITVFDNGSNGFTETASHSTGKIIHLNHRTKVARLIEVPLEPPFVDGHAHLSKSQGNFQLNLPGFKAPDVGGQQFGHDVGNRILGFGNDPFFAEYAWTVNTNDATGEVTGQWEKVFYGTLAWGWLMNYRVTKFDGWEGVPLTKPALWAYSKYGMNQTASESNSMVLYVSWNGHTKIDTFMFFGANTEDARHNQNSRDWEVLIGGFDKDGFETIYRHPRTYKYVYAEVFDKNSISLGKSLVQETFIPSILMRDRYCDDLACIFMDTNNPDRENMREEMKQTYDDWLETEANITSGNPYDILDSPPEKGGKSVSASKVVMYAFSFAFLGMLVLGVIVAAMRKFHTVQRLVDKAFLAMGLPSSRIKEQGTKGRYFGLQSEEDNDDADDTEMQRTTARSTENDMVGEEKESGLEAERQAFLRSTLS